MAQLSQFDIARGVINPCNCPSCVIASDDFNRANESPLASPWSKISGTDATLDTNVVDSSAAALYVHNTVNPEGSTGNQMVRVRFKLVAVSGGSGMADAEAVIGYTDTDNFAFARVHYDDSGCAYLAVGYRSTAGTAGADAIAGNGGTPYQYLGHAVDDELTLGEWHTLDVCLYTGTYGSGYEIPRLRAKLTLADGNIFGTTADLPDFTPGTKAGWRNFQGAMKFDDWYFEYMRESPDHRTCPNCNTPCPISEDDFERADGSDLGCKWLTPTTGASLASGKLVITAGNNIDHAVHHPQIKNTVRVLVDVMDNTGIVAQIFTGAVDVEVETDASKVYLRLYGLVGGVMTLLESDEQTIARDSNTWLSVEVCYSGGLASASVTGGYAGNVSLCASDPLEDESTYDQPGHTVGLGSDTGTVTFNNFLFYKARSTSDPEDSGCERCTSCPASCAQCEDAPPDEWVVDMGAGGLSDNRWIDCDQITGEFIIAQDTDCGWEGFFFDYDFITDCTLFQSKLWIEMGFAADTDPLYILVTLQVKTANIKDPSSVCTPVLPCETPVAIYTGTILKSACQDGFTLTKSSETWCDFCTGSLPTTISVAP